MMSSSHQEAPHEMRVLYEASYRGSVSTLNDLIHQNPLILYKISKTTSFETPLHISTSLGHLDFTKALLTNNPKLALELDASRSTPLHVASAEGHIEIVVELLKLYNQVCLFIDDEGRIPLHYAAMRGRIEVARELTKAKPESLSFLDNGKTVFHLCVRYNHLETLKAFVELEIEITGQLLNFTTSDDDGNTILHLAILLKQVESIRYLLSFSEMREAGSMKNHMGFTAHEIMERSPKDFKILEIQLMLMNAGITKTDQKQGRDDILHHPHPPAVPSSRKRNCCIRIFKCIGNWFKHKDNWLEEMRGNLSLVATVISTISFQAIISPPGGFIQQGLSSNSDTTSTNNNPLNCSIIDNDQYCPGEAISSYNLRPQFVRYLKCNTVSFVSSLSVALLLVSGVSVKNKPVIWLLSMGMCVSLTSLALAYFFAVDMIIPTHLEDEFLYNLFGPSFLAWIALLLFITVFITLRFFIWLVKTCVRTIRRFISFSRGPRNQNGCCCI
ncbi:ankyrin repeat-containing protein [Senna tora]|uniref:Ankyrin repeat-containing protein n=1 Tax=Senna tora TaxID=362788 RepID=A0A834XDF9_9FABA|nr:ankyrin repeat-containing protein [Senna tora]